MSAWGRQVNMNMNGHMPCMQNQLRLHRHSGSSFNLAMITMINQNLRCPPSFGPVLESQSHAFDCDVQYEVTTFRPARVRPGLSPTRSTVSMHFRKMHLVKLSHNGINSKSCKARQQHKSTRTVSSNMRPAAAGAARPLSAIYNANVAGDMQEKVGSPNI